MREEIICSSATDLPVFLSCAHHFLWAPSPSYLTSNLADFKERVWAAGDTVRSYPFASCQPVFAPTGVTPSAS